MAIPKFKRKIDEVAARGGTHDVGPLSMRADVVAVNAEKRTFDVVWSTGADVLRYSWFDGPFYERLSMDPAHVRMDRFMSGRAAVLADHDSWRVADQPGVIESARLEGGKGHATVRFVKAGVDPEADKLFEKIRDGITRNISVGYRNYKAEKVEGGDTTIPVFRVIDWEPHELSFVSIPADAGAAEGVRSADKAQFNPCVFLTPNRSNDVNEEEKKRQEEAAKALEAQRAADAAKKAVDAEVEKRVAAENDRQKAIRQAVRVAKLDDSFAEKAITDKLTVDAVRALVLDELAKRSDTLPPTAGQIQVGDTDEDKRQRGAVAALLFRSGMLSTVVAASTSDLAKSGQVRGMEKPDGDGGEFRGMTLLDMARESLERRGIKTRGMDRMEIAKKALSYRASSSDFPILMETALHKVLQAGYAIAPADWPLFCGVKSVSDFRAHNFYRTGHLGVLPQLNENGEFKTAAIPDGEKVSISAETYGRKLALTRKAIINDDLGSLSDLASKLGLAAQLTIEEAVFAMLAENSGAGPTVNGQAFFHSSVANIGSASALTIAAIDADAQIMEAQKDPNEKQYLMLRPEILLVHRGQKATALVVNEAQFDSADNKFQKPNTSRGLFKTIVATPRVSGATKRYLFSNPNGAAPAFVVSFLEGNRAPVLEQKEGWDTDGVEWRIRMDFGLDPFDQRGAVYNAGA